MYSAKLLDHFEHPRNAGEQQDADISVKVENPACGDVLELSLKMEADTVADVHFRAKGCVPAMACGSAVTELVKGNSVQQAAKVSRKDIVQAVGGLPPASGHAADLALDALHAALKKLGRTA